jgi:hypothetical protein
MPACLRPPPTPAVPAPAPRRLAQQVARLGGSLVTRSGGEGEASTDFTHLLLPPSAPLKKSVKLHLALAAGKPVVGPAWLEASEAAGAPRGQRPRLCLRRHAPPALRSHTRARLKPRPRTPPPRAGRFLPITPHEGLQHLLRARAAKGEGLCLREAFCAARRRRLLQGATVLVLPKLAAALKDKLPALRLVISEAGGAAVESPRGWGGGGGGGAQQQLVVLGQPDDQRWARTHLPADTPVYSREALQACILQQRLELGAPLFRA